MIREAVWLHGNNARWAAARDRIVVNWGHDQPCNALPNHGFTILGWLYGEDFGDKLCKAVNCAYDTDCTGATLGSVLGIIGGTAGVPKHWSDPVGTAIKLHPFTRFLKAPKDLKELTARTVAVAEKRASDEVQFGKQSRVPADVLSRFFRTEKAFAAAQQDVRTSVARDRDLQIVLNYHGEPVLQPGVARQFTVTCRRGAEEVPATVALKAPAGWEVANCGTGEFTVTAPAYNKAKQLKVTAKIAGENYAAAFTLLSPKEATGYPAARQVAYCPKCQGRLGNCLCQ